MKIRIVFECSRCGSKFFRPSTKWSFKDTLLRKIGVTPQRCFRCRGRFYLFRPLSLYGFLRALAASPVEAVPSPVARRAKGAAVGTDVVWSTFLEADQKEPRS
jgi:hypothetical protein